MKEDVTPDLVEELVAHASEPVNVYIQAGAVVVLPSRMPATLTPDQADALAERLHAAAEGARNHNDGPVTPD